MITKLKKYILANQQFLETLAFFSVLLFAICSIHFSSQNAVIIYGDEVGYWANGAFMAGYDWSSIVQPGFYYSYGYSFFLAPLLRLFPTGTSAYHAALAINAVFLIGTYLCIHFSLKKLFPKAPGYLSYLAAFVIALYPSYLTNANIAWSECSILFFTWLLITLLLYINQKRCFFYFGIAGVLNIYLYTIHQRTLAICIGAALFIVCMFFSKRISLLQTITYFSSCLTTLFVHNICKTYVQNFNWKQPSSLSSNHVLSTAALAKSMYLRMGVFILLWLVFIGLLTYFKKKENTKLCYISSLVFLFTIAAAYFVLKVEPVAYASSLGNDYSSQSEKVTAIFTASGFMDFFHSLCGEFFYFAVATCLVGVYGIAVLIKKLWTTFRHAETETGLTFFHYLFLFFATAGTYAISCIFMTGIDRIDQAMYGRYSEPIFSVLLLLALCEIALGTKKSLIGLPVIWILTFVTSIITKNYLENTIYGAGGVDSFISFNTSAIFWAYQDGKIQFTSILVAATILGSLIWLFLTFRRSFIKVTALLLMGCAFVGAASNAIASGFITTTQKHYEDEEPIITFIEEPESRIPVVYDDVPKDTDKTIPVYYVLEEGTSCEEIGYFQFMLQDRQLLCISDEEAKNIDYPCYFIIRREYDSRIAFSGYFTDKERVYCVQSALCNLYYIKK